MSEYLYVMQLEIIGGGGWISIHRTEEGAFTALVDRCWDILIAVKSHDYATMLQSGELDDHECCIESYGISRLPVKE